jgi:hypothetical protein
MSTSFADNVIDILDPIKNEPTTNKTVFKYSSRDNGSVVIRGNIAFQSRIKCDVQIPPKDKVTLELESVFGFKNPKISIHKIGVYLDKSNREYWWTILTTRDHKPLSKFRVGPFNYKMDMWEDIEKIYKIKMTELLLEERKETKL